VIFLISGRHSVDINILFDNQVLEAKTYEFLSIVARDEIPDSSFMFMHLFVRRRLLIGHCRFH
jgi:hypothetical protein